MLGKLFDLETLEHGIGGRNQLPFDPDMYANVNGEGGDEFGFEFDEQLILGVSLEKVIMDDSRICGLDKNGKGGNA